MTDSDKIIQTDSEELAKKCVAICEERKAFDIKLYDVQNTSLLADYFIICSGTSDPHLRALSVHLQKTVKEDYKLLPRNVEGIPASHWTILDFGIVIVHVFHPETRKYYCIEEVWGEDNLIYESKETNPYF